MVGKYVGLQDAYKSLHEALVHGGLANRVKVNINWLDAELFESDASIAAQLEPMHGVLVPGGFGERGSEGKIASVRFARERGVPFFGICLGMQMACIEGARNVAGIANASTTEFGPTDEPVVGLITEWMSAEGLQTREAGGDMGGTMRLGAYPARLDGNSVVGSIYGATEISERHRHRYEVNAHYREPLEKGGLLFSGMSPDGTLPEIRFFRSATIRIAGREVTAMRHSMGGVPGLELSGPWDDREAVKTALVQAGQAHGLRRIGSLAYFSTVIESGWWAVPFSAIYTSPQLREYRQWLTTDHAAVRMSLGGSFYSADPADYYLTPYDLGYGHIVKFDHDFVGREALEALADRSHRRKVTLLWHPDDFTGVYRRLTDDGPTAMHVDLPVSATARMHYDRVEDADGNLVGFGTYPGYSYNERAMMSLGSVEERFAEPGTELTLVWGEDGGGARSAGWIEPHEQIRVRVTVAPSPVSDVARQYRRVQTAGATWQ